MGYWRMYHKYDIVTSKICTMEEKWLGGAAPPCCEIAGCNFIVAEDTFFFLRCVFWKYYINISKFVISVNPVLGMQLEHLTCYNYMVYC